METLALNYCPDKLGNKKWAVHVLHTDGRVKSEFFTSPEQATNYSNGYRAAVEERGGKLASWPTTSFSDNIKPQTSD